MNWEAHKTLAEIACKGKVDDELLKIVIEYSIYPDKLDVQKRCYNYLKRSFYMTEDCPPHPRYHHKRVYALKAVEYYLILSRKYWINNMKARSMMEFGIFTHFAGDLILEPLVPNDGEVFWNYRPSMEDVSNYVVENKDKLLSLEKKVWIPRFSLTPVDAVYLNLLEARRLISNKEIKKAVEDYLIPTVKFSCESVVKGFPLSGWKKRVRDFLSFFEPSFGIW